MADISQAVRAIVLADADVSALIGTRFVPDALAQGETLPAITYRRISTFHYNTIDGTKDELTSTRFTFDCYAATRTAADELAKKLKLSGILDATGVTDGVNIQDITIDDGVSHHTEQNTEGSHELRYITSQDYAIHFSEEV